MKLEKGCKGWMTTEVDLEKAYDRIRLLFIVGTLSKAGLPDILIARIISCISTVSIYAYSLEWRDFG